MSNAIALSGAIIESAGSNGMRYYKRCQFCGETPNSVYSDSTPMIGSIMTSSFNCNKCGKQTKVQIKGI